MGIEFAVSFLLELQADLYDKLPNIVQFDIEFHDTGLEKHRKKNWRTNNNSKGLNYSFVDFSQSGPICNKIQVQHSNPELGE